MIFQVIFSSLEICIRKDPIHYIGDYCVGKRMKLFTVCRGTGVYSTVLEHLHRLKRDAQTEAQVALLAEYISQLQVCMYKAAGQLYPAAAGMYV